MLIKRKIVPKTPRSCNGVEGKIILKVKKKNVKNKMAELNEKNKIRSKPYSFMILMDFQHVMLSPPSSVATVVVNFFEVYFTMI